MPALVAVEGPDGSGKSFQSRALAEWMHAEWRCFPDRRTPIGKLIDLHLKGMWSGQPDGHPYSRDPLPDDMDALMFQALQLANRVEMAPEMEKTLRDGKSVVCDRYWGSGYAYGKADGLDPEYLLKIHAYLPEPSLNILIDVPIEVALERLAGRGGPPERYEQNKQFMETVAANYRELWARHTCDSRWRIIDGSGTHDVTQARIRALIPADLHRRT